MTVLRPQDKINHEYTSSDVIQSLHEIKEPTSPTSTLILTNLPTRLFLADDMAILRDRVEQIADVSKWITLKSFTRVIVSFFTINDASRVRERMQTQEVHGNIIYIYYGNSMSIDTIKAGHLQVPELEKNWLISPPGSPPVGWTQVREDAPNSQMLHTDLLEALDRLPQEFQASLMASDRVPQGNENGEPHASESMTLFEHDNVALPDIVVHMVDSTTDEVARDNGVTGISRTRVSMVKTPMPGH